MAIYARLRDGNWGIRINPSQDGAPTQGRSITVYRRNGQANRVTLGPVLYWEGAEAICAFRDERRSSGTTPAQGVPSWNSAARRNLDEVQAIPVQAPPQAAPVAPIAQASVLDPVPLQAAPSIDNVDWRALGAPQAAARRVTPAPLAIPAPASDRLSTRTVVAGASAEGHGALVGWSGQGELSRSTILEVLAEAGCPESWAPAAKSAVGHAGHAVSVLNNRGYIARRARDTATRGAGRRDWKARWVVAVADAATAGLGEAVGAVVLTVELTQAEELKIDGNLILADRVRGEFQSAKDGEIFQAGDVTAWLARILRTECGATAFGVGYYIPARGRETAGRLASALSKKWGAGWICPLLPVATGDELKVGIARGLSDEIRQVARSLEAARQKAKAATPARSEASPAEAARLLRELKDAQDHVGAYQLLCGDAVIAPIVAEIKALYETLSGLTDDASVRFALLEVNEVAEVAAPVAEVSPAERAADAAIEARRDARAERAEYEATEAAIVATLADPTITPTTFVPRLPPVTPKADPDAPKSDAEQRFSLLELD